MGNFLSQSWLIDRRHALRAMGTFIPLPMLECMVPLNADGQKPHLSRTQRVHLSGKRRALAELSDHHSRKGVRVSHVR